ncbi:TRAM domain-containing protein [Candidatus Saccharibacteria bacterium]|nr:TRAM domain-containing protein [Candidatus Saccharibacteria bacterium]
MEIFILIIVIIILAETTILFIKSNDKINITGNTKRKVYVDTSALMDNRLISVAKTGFIGDDIIIPRSVIREMQILADGKDHEKRVRARVGLDNANELERIVHFNTTILQDPLDRTPVDERLIELAKENHGLILTNDFNLNKVATTEHIGVLNLNDLQIALRNEYKPGERFNIKIVSEGSNRGQGVGYLPDGTMVVVTGAKSKLGTTVSIELTRYRQTSAGKMMFAKLTKG